MFTYSEKRVALILFAFLMTLPSFEAHAAITTAPVITTSWAISDKGTIPTVATATTILPSDYPVRVSIPSIDLDSSVLSLGSNTKGEMDVPSGKSTDVGWYKYGTVPGRLGSAVFDAHVFAAFKDLKNVASGSDVYVTMASGLRLHFVVHDSTTYKLTELTSNMVFGLKDQKRLTLITCAGSLTADRSTYDHRLVVYATLAGVEQA